MTKLLESAIAEMRKLPPEDQDEAAEMLLWAIETRRRVLPLEEEIIAAIKEGLPQARRGEFATDDELGDVWKRHDLERHRSPTPGKPDLGAYLLGGPTVDFSIERDAG